MPDEKPQEATRAPTVRHSLTMIAAQLLQQNQIGTAMLQIRQQELALYRRQVEVGENVLDIMRAGQVAALKGGGDSQKMIGDFLAPIMEMIQSRPNKPERIVQPVGPSEPHVQEENGLRVSQETLG